MNQPTTKSNTPGGLFQVISIKCTCNAQLDIPIEYIVEISSGAWGTITCPSCKVSLNEKIKLKNQILDSIVKLEKILPTSSI